MAKQQDTYNDNEELLETTSENEEITFDEDAEELEEDTQDEPDTDESAPTDETAESDDVDEEESARSKSERKRLIDGLIGDGENATSIKDLFRNMEVSGEWFRHNLAYILLITVCLLLFVTNRYQAQQETIEEARLKNELADMKYKWLTRFSELTTSTRQSQIEDRLKQLGDSTLTHSKEAPFIIKASK